MRKFLAMLLAGAMLLSLFGCADAADEEGGEPEVDQEYLDSLTDPNLTYTLEELEALEEGEHYVADYDVPALWKYFEGKMLIGASFTSNQIDLENLEDTTTKGLLKHYNIYTLGNEFKPDCINPSEGVYNFEYADEFVEFGKINGATLRGHTLLWHSQVPQWWFKADPDDTRSLAECYEAGALATSEQLQERITTYITDVVTRYKDDIDIWDVCNEVLNADSIRRIADDSYWADIIGDLDGNGYYDDYVEIAFNAARAADEDAILIINDFNMEWQDSKTQAMYDMVERMLRKGVRIDGGGFQSHIDLNCDVEHYRRNIELIAGLADVYDECFPEYAGNFRIQITELDMNMFVGENADGAFKTWSDEELEQQAEKYAELFDMFLDFADEGIIDSVVFWGTDDENSWLNSTPKLRRNAALIIDRDFSLKPSFYSIAEVTFDH